jgi:hypothetical protein
MTNQTMKERQTMNRRQVIKSGIAAAVVGSASNAEPLEASNHYYEVRTYELRNDLKPARIQEFFEQHFMPFMKRGGSGRDRLLQCHLGNVRAGACGGH